MTAVTNSFSTEIDSTWAPEFLSEFTPIPNSPAFDALQALAADVPAPSFRYLLLVQGELALTILGLMVVAIRRLSLK